MKAPLTRELCERLRSETLYRTFTLDRAAANEEDRTMPASVSSETPVQRWFGSEVLSHEEGAVDLSRAIDGSLPMFYNHDTDVLIGMARDFNIDGAVLRSTLQFAKSTRAPEVYDQVREGMPLGISIGYRVNEWVERADSDEVRVTSWTLHEVSVVGVPADPTVGINRSIEETSMTDEEKKKLAEQQRSLADRAPANIRLVHDQARLAGVEEERARIAEIRSLFLQPNFQGPEYQELERLAIDGGLSAEETRNEILNLAGSNVSPVAAQPRQLYTTPVFTGPSERFAPQRPLPQRQFVQPQMPAFQPQGRAVVSGGFAPQPFQQMPSVFAGRDTMEGFYEGASRAIELRAGLLKTNELRTQARNGNEFVGMTLAEMAADCLRRAGYDLRGFDKTAIVGMALTMAPSFVRGSTISHGTGDFANVLLDAANKSLLAGWTENDETYGLWTRSMNISDFKTNNLVNLSNFGDLDVVPEFGEYKYGTFSDLKETITLRTYGKLFNISRQAIINDDLSVFTTVPSKMGRAAARMVGDEAYAVLTANPTLNQDSLAVFHATHGNYVSSGGSAPSVTSLDAMFTAMATRTDPSGATLNIRPRNLIVPVALENTARTLVAAQYDPAGTAGTLKPNTMQGRLQVVADARLDAFNAAGWFGAADPSQVGTVVVGFLDGRTEPYLEQKEAFSQDGIAMKVRLDCRAVPEDFRGLYYNDGA